MPIKQVLSYKITPTIANALMRIERLKERIQLLPQENLTYLIEKARVEHVTYSSLLDGNRFTLEQVAQLLHSDKPALNTGEREIRYCSAAVKQVEIWTDSGAEVNERTIPILHSLLIGQGNGEYRQLHDRLNETIAAYLPTEATAVPGLINSLIAWLKESSHLPCPIVAAIAQCRLLSIHPYYEANGRIARLLSMYILHAGGYGLSGCYALEGEYAQNPGDYYTATTINFTRSSIAIDQMQAEITPWLDYFTQQMAISLEKIWEQAAHLKKADQKEQHQQFRQLDPKQRHALALFNEYEVVTAGQIGALFGYKVRTTSALCKKWAEIGFLQVIDFSKKGRKYKLGPAYQDLLTLEPA